VLDAKIVLRVKDLGEDAPCQVTQQIGKTDEWQTCGRPGRRIRFVEPRIGVSAVCYLHARIGYLQFVEEVDA
jgi:hypothetical protein